MLTVNVLGHTYLSRQGVPLALPGKSLALLTYLALETRPTHREVLADLLWEGPSALGNLRTELSKLRGLNIWLGPPRAPLLQLEADTDLMHWQSRLVGAKDWVLDDWLSILRGIPLSGLEDLGTPKYAEWLEGQRQRLDDIVERGLREAWDYESQLRQGGLVRIKQKAEQLGLSWPDLPDLGSAEARRAAPLHPALHQTWPSGLKWEPDPELVGAIGDIALEAANAPQAVLLGGRESSGRRMAVAAATQHRPWLRVELAATRDLTQFLSAFIMQLIPQLPEERRPDFRGLLADPLPEDRVGKLGLLLMELGQPVLLLVKNVEDLSTNLLVSLGFSLDWPIEMLFVLLSHPLSLPRLSMKLGQYLPQDRLHVLEMPPLTKERVVVESPQANVLQALCRGEGWLLATREQLPQPAPALPAKVKRALLLEVEQEVPEHRENLIKLARLPMPFTQAEAQTALVFDRLGTVRQALALNLLELVPEVVEVRMPERRALVAPPLKQMAFFSELMRQALAENGSSLDDSLTLAVPTFPLPSLNPLYELMVSAADVLGAGLPPLGQRGTARFAGGYFMHLEESVVRFYRCGSGKSPTLRLSWLNVPTGEVEVVGRLDHFEAADSRDFPLAVCDEHGDWSTDAAQLSGFGWFKLRGPACQGPLHLSLRAKEVVLTIRSLTVGGQPVAF